MRLDSSKEFTSPNGRSAQNYKRYSTTNNEVFFQFRCNTQSIKNFQEIFTENRKTIKYCTEIVTYRASFLWANLHTKYKNAKSLDEFKSKIKAWKCDFCQCRLGKKVKSLGFI